MILVFVSSLTSSQVNELSKHLVLNVSRPLTFLSEILSTLEGVNKNCSRSQVVTRGKIAK